MKNFIHILSHFIFWAWNLTFIAVMYIWCLPQVGFELWRSAWNGDIESTFIVSFVALMVVPLVCTLLGLFRLRKYPVLLMRLFYGVEAPLFTLCLLRLFLIRELTVASGFTLGVVVVAIAMFAIELLTGYAAYRPHLAKVQMVAHSLILAVGLYLGALLLLYSIPTLAMVTVGFVVNFFQFRWLDIGWVIFHPLSLLVGFLMVGSLLVFLSMPHALVNFYLQAWARIRAAFAQQYSTETSWIITGTTLAVTCLLFAGLQNQPQIKAFDLLATEPANAAELVEVRQSQLQDAKAIKAGLTNAYLYRYRYLSPWAESNALSSFYGDAFNIPENKAKVFKSRIQNTHNALLSPFLYRGEESDVEKAAELYAQFFDEPIQQGDRTAIRTALKATANRDETKAGLLNLDQKVIRLASQDVTVAEQGDWATVEIHEQYENTTFEDQEIFYTFSLPESAAINGLWLGDADSPKLFPFVVSPRGAAQQVYNAEVERAKFQRATDPALLEQVGPRQYRLRVFPIPAASRTFNRSPSTPGELHLWMSYQVMQQNGEWPLPQLTEKRNIYWNKETAHLRGDRTVELAEDEWFETALPATKAKAKGYAVELASGDRITAAPLTKREQRLPTGKEFAVIVDSSYSMENHSEALKRAVSDLQSAKKNNFDFYITSAGSKSAAAQSLVAVNGLLFYGSLQPAEMLKQFAATGAQKSYDAVLLLTDKGSYELAKDEGELPEIESPLWIVHVDGKLPSAYSDKLLQQLQASRGGVETSALSALQRIALGASDVVALDGYTWKVDPKEKTAEQPADSADSKPDKASESEPEAMQPLEAIAARQLIWQQTRTLDTSKVAALDAVHEIAKRNSIVTPYSSMLVLVDERQREALKAAEAGEDRFEREVEDGQDDLTNPGNPLANPASVPEPSQVLSLLVGAIALILLKRKSASTP